MADTNTAPTTAPTTTTVPHVKFTLTAKGLLQYELTLTYTTVDDLLAHAAQDAHAFDNGLRLHFANVVPQGTPGKSAD